MENMRKMLQDMVGIEGLESLNKAIYRSATQSVADPMELYLPLMVVPRTILSWLVQNIQPLKVGQYKDLDLPGQPGTSLHIEKQATDVYRGEIVQGGKVIHSFEKQSLPSIGGHMMTVFEQYDHLKDPVVMDRKEAVKEHEKLVDVLESKSHEDDKEEAKEQQKELDEYKSGTEPKPSLELPKMIMDMNGVRASSPEDAKWAYSHMNVKELVGVIGKLVDALVANHKTKSDLAEAIGKDEMKSDDQKPKEDKEPQLLRPEAKDQKPESEEHGQPDLSKEDMPADKPKPAQSRISAQQYFRMSRREKMARAHQAFHEAKHGKPDPKRAMDAAVAAIENKFGKNPPAKKMDTLAAAEPLSKPYVSDAQRRWAHTAAGTKALGGKAAVHHWDEATKGKKLPEHVDKAGEMPGGAGMAKKPQAAQMPMPPVPQSKNPAAAAAKQSQAAARGQQVKPPTAPKPPKAPSGMTNKSDEHCGGNYFSGRLAKLRGKAEYGMGLGGGFPGGANAGSAGPALAATEKNDTIRYHAERGVNKPHAIGSGVSEQGYTVRGGMKIDSHGDNGKMSFRHPKGGHFDRELARVKAKRTLSELKEMPKPDLGKSEAVYHLSEEEVYTPCAYCGVAEFEKTETGPKFKPCYCFMVMAKNEEGKDVWFVRLSKSSNGYKVTFNPQADKESIAAFMKTLKARLARTNE